MGVQDEERQRQLKAIALILAQFTDELMNSLEKYVEERKCSKPELDFMKKYPDMILDAVEIASIEAYERWHEGNDVS